MDTRLLLSEGGPDEGAAFVRRLAATPGEGGGLIEAPSHVLQTAVPTANIVAL